MNKNFQPHEAHIPFLLQLFIDYNLYGMNLINLGAVKFRRRPPPQGKGAELTAHPANCGVTQADLACREPQYLLEKKRPLSS